MCNKFKVRPVSPDIIIFALIAAFLIHRLRSVLGTRTGHEKDSQNPYAQQKDQKKSDDNVIALHADNENSTEAPASNEQYMKPEKPAYTPTMADLDPYKTDILNRKVVKEGVLEIAAEDARFHLGNFLNGARSAYEIIIEAYAKGDRETLKPLLSPKLYTDFETAITAREKKGTNLVTDITQVTKSQISEANLAGSMAYITVKFEAEERTATYDSARKLIDGDMEKVKQAKDVWQFARDIRAVDPSWMLIETRSA